MCYLEAEGNNSTYLIVQICRLTWHISDWHAWIKRGGYLCNTCPDPLKNHKITKPALNVWPSLARPRNVISMVFCCWVNDGPLIVVFRSSPHKLKKTKQKKGQSWTPSDKTFWICACLKLVSGQAGLYYTLGCLA